jgi:hypothetical protein
MRQVMPLRIQGGQYQISLAAICFFAVGTSTNHLMYTRCAVSTTICSRAIAPPPRFMNCANALSGHRFSLCIGGRDTSPLAAMAEHVKANWQHLGSEDPHWSALRPGQLSLHSLLMVESMPHTIGSLLPGQMIRALPLRRPGGETVPEN